MNDHITKPIDPDYLASVLAHWVSRSLTVVNRATPRPPGATMRRRRSDGARPAIDFASAQTRVGGSRELLLRLLGDFSRDFAAAPAEIRRALQRGDVDSARRQVQTLKGTASNLSVTRVHAAAVSVEKAMRAGSADRALALMDQLEAVLASALQAVSALQSPPGNGATPRDEGNGSRPEYRNGARHNGVTLEREIAHE